MSPDEDAMVRLDELAELGMGIVRRLSDATRKTEDAQTLIGLAGAFHDVSRGVRQSIALHLRISRGTYPGERLAAPSETTPGDTERPERLEVERCDWNEYERPDWVTPERLDAGEALGDEASEDEVFETDVDAAVVRIRRDYAKGLAVLEPAPRRTGRAALLAGSAHLRLVDSS